MNIHMQADKKGLRFDCIHGNLSSEDLWNLRLEDLDRLVTFDLKDKVKETEEVSYLDGLDGNRNVTKDDNLRFQVAEAIIIARVEEVQAQQKAADNKLKRQRLLEIIASKEAQDLEGQDLETLKEMADSLG